MNTRIDEDFLHALFLLKSTLNAEFGKKIDSDDLNMPEYALMRCLSEENDFGDLASIREYLAVTKASVSQMLASLEKRGLLVRETDPADRRNLIVTLTKDGQERLRLKEAQVNLRIEELLTALGESDALRFIALVNKMNSALSGGKEER